MADPAGPLGFVLPDDLDALQPPEALGRRRDEVRLLLAERASGTVSHACLPDLPVLLEPGDLLVVNTSATLPAALPATRPDGSHVRLHVGGPLPQPSPAGGAGAWLVELRRPAGPGSAPLAGGRPGEHLRLPAGGFAVLHRPYRPRPGRGARLWEATLELPLALLDYLGRHGHPIRYRTAGPLLSLEAYQTVFATVPGSAESPSAARPFSAELVTALAAAGVGVAPLVLHAGVSSLESGESPYPEWYDVPAATAERVGAARADGHRVIAVGTTVARALESATGDDGRARPREGWTELEITPQRGIRGFDGLLTGWHEPRSSHLNLLEAVAGRPLLEASYAAALSAGYRWHEFGDLHLILP